MDILKKFEVSYYPSGKNAVKMVLCFDSGSPFTFIKRSSGLKIGKSFKLVEPRPFYGLGGGKFKSKEIIYLYIKVLKFWCSQVAHIVEDEILDENYDILIGHDFMQLYGINLVPHKGDIEIDEERLKLAQKIKIIL
jgi:hypothetical protein